MPKMLMKQETICKLLLIPCLFFALGAEEPREGLFERMIIEKITSLESNLKELMGRVDSIEKRLTRVEKTLTERPVPPPFQAQDQASPMTTTQEPPKKRLKPLVPKEKDIGNGLRVIAVDYHGTGENTFFKGEIENSTRDDIESALFKIEIYGEQGDLLGQESLELKDIKRAWPKKFTLILYKVDSDLIADYTIKWFK